MYQYLVKVLFYLLIEKMQLLALCLINDGIFRLQKIILIIFFLPSLYSLRVNLSLLSLSLWLYLVRLIVSLSVHDLINIASNFLRWRVAAVRGPSIRWAKHFLFIYYSFSCILKLCCIIFSISCQTLIFSKLPFIIVSLRSWYLL